MTNTEGKLLDSVGALVSAPADAKALIDALNAWGDTQRAIERAAIVTWMLNAPLLHGDYADYATSITEGQHHAG